MITFTFLYCWSYILSPHCLEERNSSLATNVYHDYVSKNSSAYTTCVPKNHAISTVIEYKKGKIKKPYYLLLFVKLTTITKTIMYNSWYMSDKELTFSTCIRG